MSSAREARDLRFRRALKAAMVLSAGAHGALFALGGFNLDAASTETARDEALAPRPDDATWSDAPLRVVRLTGAEPRGDAGQAGTAAAPRRARTLQLPAPSPAAAVSLITPAMRPVASDRPPAPGVTLASAAPPLSDPAVRAFRARMEVRSGQIDYRAASHAAREAQEDGGDGAARGGYGGAGPGCPAPPTGGRYPSPVPGGAGPRR